MIEVWKDRLKWWRSHGFLCCMWSIVTAANAVGYFMDGKVVRGVIMSVCFGVAIVCIVLSIYSAKMAKKVVEVLDGTDRSGTSEERSD